MAAASVIYRLGTSAQALHDTYAAWNDSYSNLSSYCAWILSSLTEPEFYTCTEAGIGLTVGGFVALYIV
jgi:hypothetical protein